MPWTALGLTFAAGQNPYAALFLLAVLARSEDVEVSLQTPLTFLSHTAVIGVLFVLAGAQVFADKHPRWGRYEAMVSAVTRPFCAAAIVLSLLDAAAASVWLWLAVAVVIALCSHVLRVAMRRQLAERMAGMGYFLASLTLDSAALITGLLAILAPVVGAVLGVLMLGGSAVLSFRWRFTAGTSQGTES
ncbi:MAG: DUF4126 domain-containing protein [Chloroflexota bacterium]|nr:DUF4126 domain-containing protein [Chloroflexota bacterium]